LPVKQVISYSELSRAAEVPLGSPGENPVVRALVEIFEYCDFHRLPPLPSIVVKDCGTYDPHKQHGMPSGEYLVCEANSLNNGNRFRMTGISQWRKEPRPRDTDAWKFKTMIEAHQDMVWDWTGGWWK